MLDVSIADPFVPSTLDVVVDIAASAVAKVVLLKHKRFQGIFIDVVLIAKRRFHLVFSEHQQTYSDLECLIHVPVKTKSRLLST